MSIRMSRRSFLVGGASAAAAWSLPSWALSAEVGRDREAQIDALDVIVERSLHAGACPGVSLRIYRQGKPQVARDFGMANLETGAHIDGGSVFRIGSLTKQFVAAMVVLLASKGRLDLDAPASHYLPCFAGQSPFTLRELLTHTAGLHDDEQAVSCPAGPHGVRTQREQAAEIAAQRPLFDFPPGTAWLYSNANYIVLGAVVEVVTGMPLAKAASTLVFAPLGLRHTAFDDTREVVEGRVSGYTPVDGQPGRFEHAAFIEIADAGGAGAMRSTADELCAWHQALFSGRLMPAAFVRQMITPGRLRDGRLSGANRHSAADAVYGETQYGMGLLLTPPSGGHRSVMHYGFINGFAACLESFLDVGVTVAILCNGDMGPNMPFRDLRRAVVAAWLGGLPPDETSRWVRP